MNMNYDFRFCVRASLQIMQNERRKICEDTMRAAYPLGMGLHGLDRDLCTMYFQLYEIEWLEDHWKSMQEILVRHKEYSVDQRKQMALFFTGYYSKMIDTWKVSGVLSQMLLPELLKAQRKAVQEMISRVGVWEQKSHELEVLMLKQKEEFELRIKQYKSS